MSSIPKVICLGEALVDRLGPVGVDPATVSRDLCDDRFGGAPANVACALARLGTPSAFVGRLGSDPIGDRFVELMARRQVSLSALQRDPIRPTRIVMVQRSTNGERAFLGFSGDLGEGFSDQALDCSELQAVWPSLVSKADWLLVGTIPLASVVSSEALCWALDQSQITGLKVALDVNWRPSFWDKSLSPTVGPDASVLSAIQPVVEAASLLKLAKEEAYWLFGTADPLVISTRLPNSPDIVVTDGARPVHWYLAGDYGVLDAFIPPNIVDTTGAGDAFFAGLLHQLVQSRSQTIDPEQMLRFAVACGGLVCGGAGAIDPQPDYSEVVHFLQN